MKFDVDGRLRVRTRDGGWQHFSRCLMEGHLKRHLTFDEVVHHVNGDPTDDRIENLQLVSRKAHIALHRDEMNTGLRAAAKLTPEHIREIHESGERTAELAHRFGVTWGAVHYHRRLRSQSRQMVGV